jgi:signal transduction histidine kinase
VADTQHAIPSPEPPPESRPRRRFLRFSSGDARRLRALSTQLDPFLPEVVEAFLDHLRRFAPLRPLLDESGRVDRLHAILLTYLREMFAGDYGARYQEKRQRVGERHLELGIDTRWYLGSFNVLMQLLLPHIARIYAANPQAMLEAITSLSRLITLDQELALDRYIEVHTRRLDDANKALREYADNLQATVESRTQELIRSGRFVLIGELASGLAHEIGTPLNIISGTADWLRSELPPDSPHRTELATIVRQTERITNLVWQLLRFARPDQADLVPTRLHDVIDQAVSFLQHRFENHRIAVTLEIPEDLPDLRAVPEQLQQVFLNLLVNAGHALEGQQVRQIRVSARSVDRGVEVRVIDTGSGIPERHLPRLFDPFFTTKPPGKGTGLGLSITQRILAEHDGSIHITPMPEGGTCFTVHLPVWDEP